MNGGIIIGVFVEEFRYIATAAPVYQRDTNFEGMTSRGPYIL